MKTTETQHNWFSFIKLFSLQNKSRPTRLGVFEGKPGAATDYWLADGLPLEGIDLDSRGGDSPAVEIMLGESGQSNTLAFTHTIPKTRFVKIILSDDGKADGLEIESEDGAVTVLRFENQPEN